MSTSPRVAIYTRVAKKIESNHRAAALVWAHASVPLASRSGGSRRRRDNGLEPYNSAT
jgi:hypothetical protein